MGEVEDGFSFGILIVRKVGILSEVRPEEGIRADDVERVEENRLGRLHRSIRHWRLVA